MKRLIKQLIEIERIVMLVVEWLSGWKSGFLFLIKHKLAIRNLYWLALWLFVGVGSCWTEIFMAEETTRLEVVLKNYWGVRGGAC